MAFVTIITLASLSRHEDDTTPVKTIRERKLYAPQTKILEGLTTDEMRIFEHFSRA
jgi:hypothetical protein